VKLFYCVIIKTKQQDSKNVTRKVTDIIEIELTEQ